MASKEYPLLTWESGKVPANKNQLGLTVNWILPDVDVTEFTLRLRAGNATSEYRLYYRKSETLQATRQMNV